MLEKRLDNIVITDTLCLGTKVSMTAKQILERMSDKQIEEMLLDNLNARYVLLDSDLHRMWSKSKI